MFCISLLASLVKGKKKKRGYVPLNAVKIALQQVKKFMRARQHHDIDDVIEVRSAFYWIQLVFK